DKSCTVGLFPRRGGVGGEMVALAQKDGGGGGERAPTATSETTLTAHWNGQRWTVVPSPNATASDSLGSVSAISSNDVWAVGCGNFCGSDTGAGSLLVEHWDGTQWTINPTPQIGNGEMASGGILALPSGDIFVAGTVSGNGIFAGTLVLHGRETQ